MENEKITQAQVEKTKTFSLDTFKVDALEEIKNKRKEQLKVVKENPFIEIVDNDTFTNAKKHRTALVSARTALEKEKTSVIKKIKENITIPVSLKYDEFIAITSPHELTQQAEVKRWEEIKEKERLEKLRLEEERKEKHRSTIKSVVDSISNDIKNLCYESSLTYDVDSMVGVTPESLEEFGSKLIEETESLKFTLEARKETLKQQEELRLEKIRLENERKENERIRLEQEAENKRLEVERQLEQDAANEKLELEKQKLESERRAIQLEKENILKSQRIEVLKKLGFDSDLVLNLEHVKIIYPEEDLLCDEEEFQVFINNTKNQIENPPAPVVEEAVQNVLYEEETTLNEAQIIQQTLLNDFCDWCLTEKGYIDQEFVIEYVTK